MISRTPMKLLVCAFRHCRRHGSFGGQPLPAAPNPSTEPAPDRYSFASASRWRIISPSGGAGGASSAAGVEIQVRAREIPNVSASGATRTRQGDLPVAPPTSNTWGHPLQARQLLFAGGGVTASIKGARLTREAAEPEMEGHQYAVAGGADPIPYTVLLGMDEIQCRRRMSAARKAVAGSPKPVQAPEYFQF